MAQNKIVKSNAITVTPDDGTLSASGDIGSGKDYIVLKVSGDQFLGDPQFNVLVDGLQIGGTFDTSAMHASGQQDTLTVKGTWTPGQHSVSVKYINDGYGGSADKDRNLWVNSIQFNGAPVSGEVLLADGGQRDFAFQALTPVATSRVSISDMSGHKYITNGIASGSQTLTPDQTGLNRNITQSVGSNGVNTISTPLWNDVRVLNVNDTGGASYATNAFMEADFTLNNAQKGSLLLTNAKRGVINLDKGNYNVTVNAYSNAKDLVGQNLNEFAIKAGAGNDTVVVNGYKDSTNVSFTAGSGTDRFTFVGSGSAQFVGGSGASKFQGGNGLNSVVFGSGTADVSGGSLADNFTYHQSSGIGTIQNFQSMQDQLNIDSSLKASAQVTSNSSGSTIQFGSADHQITLVGVQNFSLNQVNWT